ncbi:hypothetical protein HCU01_01730 [Halomonas cupida]|uniref:Uncharacterized protein n=1 Tax=Halomonas cupida TaxID=44933 RepID=A0A1M7AX84_9GAMM|nr:hypothetical protein [Halomonas cupida]GEN22224.1 hypothetical protein HCU01_01730 [Halomonas cupida]SHL47342.1 hypothetical protein SAMN05660971_00677 [Halomonas cupida]
MPQHPTFCPTASHQPARRAYALPLAALLMATTLSACTTYTWDDGRKETVWGVPTEDETKTQQERQAEGVQYREPGEIPE